MKRNATPRRRTHSALGTLFIISFILFSSFSYGQSPVNFSGDWIQDPAKSDDFYKEFVVKYTIIQTPQVFKVKQTMTLRGSEESITNDYAFTLDGKVTTMDKEGGKEKELAQWSADKKSLITKSTTTYGNEDVGFTETYSLSDNGLVLTTLKANIIEGLPKVKQVFTKKQ